MNPKGSMAMAVGLGTPRAAQRRRPVAASMRRSVGFSAAPVVTTPARARTAEELKLPAM